MAPFARAAPDPARFNQQIALPYQLRLKEFELAMQDVYDFFHDVNASLWRKGLPRFDDLLRPAAMSGIISDLLSGCLARHSRTLIENRYHNGHPDLIVRGRYANDSVQAGEHGIEVKTTRKKGGAVDTHGARDQWMCVFVYAVDNQTEPAVEREPMEFREVYLAQVRTGDFRRNARGELGTRTATLHREGLGRLREGWVYRA